MSITSIYCFQTNTVHCMSFFSQVVPWVMVTYCLVVLHNAQHLLVVNYGLFMWKSVTESVHRILKMIIRILKTIS